jgi:hypothetical protein
MRLYQDEIAEADLVDLDEVCVQFLRSSMEKGGSGGVGRPQP